MTRFLISLLAILAFASCASYFSRETSASSDPLDRIVTSHSSWRTAISELEADAETEKALLEEFNAHARLKHKIPALWALTFLQADGAADVIGHGIASDANRLLLNEDDMKALRAACSCLGLLAGASDAAYLELLNLIDRDGPAIRAGSPRAKRGQRIEGYAIQALGFTGRKRAASILLSLAETTDGTGYRPGSIASAQYHASLVDSNGFHKTLQLLIDGTGEYDAGFDQWFNATDEGQRWREWYRSTKGLNEFSRIQSK